MSVEPVRKRKWDEPAEGAAPKLAKTEDSPAPANVDSAREAAAKIAAQLAGHNPNKAATPEAYVAGAREVGDPDFVKDIDINDIRNRYLLTKGATQEQVMAETGVTVATKGVWYPDRSMVKEKDPPLYLHITADSQEKLDAGVAAIEKLIDQELGPLIDMRRFERDQPRERRKWPEEKVFIELDPLRNFNIRAKVVGPGGLFVKYIQQETQTRVQIKGIGSGFIETDTGRENEDEMHIHVTGPDQVMVDEATKMAKDLLEVVKEEHEKAKAVLEQGFQQQQQGGQSFNGMAPGQGWGARHQQQQQQQQHGYGQQQGGYGGGYGQQQQGYQHPQGQYPQGVTAPLPPGEAPPPPPGEAPPPPPAQPGSNPIPPQPAGGTASPEEWANYWNSLDGPSQAYFLQYYAPTLAAPQPQAAAPAPPSGPPPPPPPSNAPPEPPRQEGRGTYGAVPPPPGL